MKQLEFKIIEKEEFKDYICYDCPYPCDTDKENCKYYTEAEKVNLRKELHYRRYLNKLLRNY